MGDEELERIEALVREGKPLNNNDAKYLLDYVVSGKRQVSQMATRIAKLEAELK